MNALEEIYNLCHGIGYSRHIPKEAEEIIEEPEIKKSLPVQTLDEAFGEPEKLEE